MCKIIHNESDAKIVNQKEKEKCHTMDTDQSVIKIKKLFPSYKFKTLAEVINKIY